MEFPHNLKYTPEHEWIRRDGDRGIVGITAYAVDQLGDVVFVELPKVGTTVTQGQTFGVVESVKTASDLYAPVSGIIIAVNGELADKPELVNEDPYVGGWMIEIQLSDPSLLTHLLSAEQYEALLPR